jgi:hypothetical protein
MASLVSHRATTSLRALGGMRDELACDFDAAAGLATCLRWDSDLVGVQLPNPIAGRATRSVPPVGFEPTLWPV